jgi:hypothetical protein
MEVFPLGQVTYCKAQDIIHVSGLRNQFPQAKKMEVFPLEQVTYCKAQDIFHVSGMRYKFLQAVALPKLTDAY